jgi:hypothetical protein
MKYMINRMIKETLTIEKHENRSCVKDKNKIIIFSCANVDLFKNDQSNGCYGEKRCKNWKNWD